MWGKKIDDGKRKDYNYLQFPGQGQTPASRKTKENTDGTKVLQV